MMNTKEFLCTVLGDQGYYCSLGLMPKHKKKVQKFYTSIDSLVASAANLDEEGFDAYFALSTFVDDKSRTAENVQSVKALFLDIDCGPTKPYADQVAAIKALRTFCTTTGVPSPTAMVNSGRGVHVYWALDKAYPKSEWLLVAEKLKIVCAENGLDADPVVTSDPARVLRIPNTHNYKGEPPFSVELIGDVGDCISLDAFAKSLPTTNMIPVLPQRTFSAQDVEVSKRLIGNNYTKKFVKILEKTVTGVGCNQINKAVMQPNDLSYGEWLSVLSIAKFCEEEQAIHMISEGYAEYDPEETEKIASSIRTPHLCTTFAQNNPAGCEGCPHKGKIKTPISLGMELREATEEDNIIQVVEAEDDSGGVLIPIDSGLFANVAAGGSDDSGDDDDEAPSEPTVASRIAEYKIPPYPSDYRRLAGGGIYKETKDEEGNQKQDVIYKKDLYLTKRIVDPVAGPKFEFKHHTSREGIRTFLVDGVKLTSRDEFRKAMAMNDIHLLRPEPLMHYVAAWIEELQENSDEIRANTQFGWTEGRRSFVIGDREVFPDGVRPNPPSSATAMHFPAFKKQGTLEGWKEMAEFYTKPGNEQHQFMMAVGFGAPLLSFVPNIAGLITHLFNSDSGIGKSTGMYGGASIWGDPAVYVMPGNSTPNGIWNRAEVWKNLPLYIDEVTNLPPKDTSDIAYSVSSGQQKVRMSSSGQNEERYRGEPWKLLIGTTGNVGLLDKIYQYKSAPKGEYQRVVETRAQQVFFTSEDTEITDVFNKKLAANFGHAGEVHMQYILNNMQHAEELVLEYRKNIIKLAQLTDQNRIWSAGVACCLAGTQLAVESGLVPTWEVENLTNWIVRRLSTLKVTEQELNLDVGELINSYYAHYQGAIMRIKSTADSRRKDNTGLEDMLVIPEKTPHYSVVGRYETDIGRLYLLIQPFKEWCQKQQYVYDEVFEALAKAFGATKEKIRFGRGTTMRDLPNGWAIAMTFKPPEEIAEEVKEALFSNEQDSTN